MHATKRFQSQSMLIVRKVIETLKNALILFPSTSRSNCLCFVESPRFRRQLFHQPRSEANKEIAYEEVEILFY